MKVYDFPVAAAAYSSKLKLYGGVLVIDVCLQVADCQPSGASSRGHCSFYQRAVQREAAMGVSQAELKRGARTLRLSIGGKGRWAKVLRSLGRPMTSEPRGCFIIRTMSASPMATFFLSFFLSFCPPHPHPTPIFNLKKVLFRREVCGGVGCRDGGRAEANR